MKTLTFGAILIGVCALLLCGVMSSEKAVRKRKEKGDEYDERQRLVRGDAYRRALYAVLFFLFVDSLISVRRPWAETPSVRLWMAVYVSVFVFSMEAIRHDAFLKLGTNPKKELAITLAAAALTVPLSVYYLNRGSVIRNGMLTKDGSFCIITLFYLVTVAAMVDRLLRVRREERENEE